MVTIEHAASSDILDIRLVNQPPEEPRAQRSLTTDMPPFEAIEYLVSQRLIRRAEIENSGPTTRIGPIVSG